MYKAIYEVEVITSQGDLVSRRFFGNKKAAKKHATLRKKINVWEHENNYVSMRKLTKVEKNFVRLEDVER